MTHDPSALEAELRELHAASLDEALLLRLEAAVDGTLLELTHEEIRFEALLRETTPAKLSAEFLAEIEILVRDVPLSGNDKIVKFPDVGPAVHTRRKQPMWAAAAAVALIGAATAFLMPAGNPPQSVVRQSASVPSPVNPAATENFVPAAFNRGVSEVHDEGVVWKSNQPHSVVRVVYQDKITLKDKHGRTYQVERPRVEYMMVPAKAN